MVKHKHDEVAQAPHTAEECKINEHPHNNPAYDCGHEVKYGPATGVSDPDNDKYHPDQDVAHGPGVPNPPANDQQDPEHGPGVK